MQVLINALLLAVLLPAGSPAPEPNCRGRLAGQLLTTTIEFEDGYGMEAPWRVTQTQRAELSDHRSMLLVELFLDRVVEFDELTGKRNTTPLPEPVRVQVEGRSDAEVVSEAADTWCSSVMKARGTESQAVRAALPKPGRIT